ncbi:glycosyltransferase family 2 protein [Silvibacterium acidisoli]|uniref:glycosyltransferase family 2 protein n=1 Tax=Acidobacteriaceae bacterium ZG23-2 TaxID=2883246 RepID=UPI00406BF671
MTKLLFLIIGLVLAGLTLPLITELFLVTVAGLLPRRRRQSDAASLPDFPLAIVMPSHNEEIHVGRAVSSVVASAAGLRNIRIYTVAHNCSDRTAEEAAKAGAEVLVYNDPEARGKGYALNHGFAHALANGAEAVMVIDADSIISANLVGLVQRRLAAGADAVQCRYEMESANDKANGRLAALALRGFNVIRPRGRQQLGLSCGILGNGFALTKRLLDRVPYDAFSVVEDLEYHIHLVMAGSRVQYIEEAHVLASLPASAKGETVQRSRWEGGRFYAARIWFVPLLKQVLRGRLRLIEPMCDVAGLPMAFGVFALLLALLIPVPAIRIYAAVSLAVVTLHVLAAAAAGPDFLGTLRLLAMAPFYILWKLRLIPSILRGSKGKADWVRTDRDSNFRSIS